MKYILLFLSVIIFGSFRQPDTPVDLKIIVTNVKNLKGRIHMGIFDHPKSFLKKGKAYKSYSQKVTGDTVVFILKGLKKSDYAISLYHDVNSDSKCNLNFIGIPIEPYGFSKNFKPTFSKPDYDDCKINVQKNSSTIIELII